MSKNRCFFKIIFLFLTVALLASCKSKSRIVTTKHPSKPKTHNHTTSSNTTITTKRIINKAVSFKGTKYKYGGTTKKGMDCSGLMFVAFKAGHINLPRTSYEQSKKGIRISKKHIKKGDLLFFKTGRKNKINHVGLVVSNQNGNVKFVHASTSKGVMISSLKDGYWQSKFILAKRIEAPSKTTSNTPQKPLIYTVKKGDTFYGIARKFNGVSAQNIMDLNHLKASDLKPGMHLQIPN